MAGVVSLLKRELGGELEIVMPKLRKNDGWNFSEWTIPEIESESISLLIKRAVATAVQIIFEEDDIYKEVEVRTRSKKTGKKGLFFVLTFDLDDGTKIIEKEINAWDYVEGNLIEGLGCDDNSSFLDFMMDLSSEFKSISKKIDDKIESLNKT